MKRIFTYVFIFFLLQLTFAQNDKSYSYESVAGDKLGVRIYTLSNGLKVYMSVNKEEPTITAYVAVRAGAKHDPPESTGLAHYFEHMMFKGTPNVGTLNWEEEKKFIDQIEQLFEQYRAETDPSARAAIYRKIDSLSYEASKLAIPNEYDKMMKHLGSKGTNAATSYDYTFYIENIPSNQLENWAIIQLDRFTHPVLRLFHTELETVYEEKNMSLTNDGRKTFEAALASLFPHHPYGKQTVLGSVEHLKNPSMKNINEFFRTWYVPNNMAIILAGDFDPDHAIRIIDKTFGTLKPMPLQQLSFPPEQPITEPIKVTVKGLEAENVVIGFRFPGAASDDALMLRLVSMILFNQKAGLIDQNINQKQLAIGAYASPFIQGDYSVLFLGGRPASGQTLEQLEQLLLEQIELLKAGQFPDWILEAAINNLKLQEMQMAESNNSRARLMMNAFIYNIPWEKQVSFIDQLSKITKQDIINFAQKYFGSNYVVIYKKQETPDDLPKVAKPPITPVHINRDVESDFFKNIKNRPVEPIQPVFVDFQKAIARGMTKNKEEILYVENTENNTFQLVFYFPFGRWHNKIYPVLSSVFQYLGTSEMSAAQMQQEFYKLACSYSLVVHDEEMYIILSGLAENTVKALELLEKLIQEPKLDPTVFDNLINNILKERENNKANQNANFAALSSYAAFGPHSPYKHILSEQELKVLTPAIIQKHMKSLFTYPHSIFYYGPAPLSSITEILNKYHKSSRKKVPVPQIQPFIELPTTENKVYFAHYDANQSFLQLIIRSTEFQPQMMALVNMFNEYFGGSMNALVFQELRERRALAYTARSVFAIPVAQQRPFVNRSFIATQNDKVVDAFDAYNELFDNMPLSPALFETSKTSLLNKIETERITKMNLIWRYIANKRLGFDYDYRKDIYQQVQQLTLDDMKKFADTYLRNKTKTYLILGRESDMDFNAIQKYGPVHKLKPEDIFGY